MFSKYTCFEITYMDKVKRKAEKQVVKSRSYSAIAFRISGKSVFKSASETYAAEEGSILYMPAVVDLLRISTDEELYIIHMNTINNNDCSIEVLNADDFLSMQNNFENMYKEWKSKSPGYKHKCTAMLHMILASIESTNRSIPNLYNSLESSKYLLINSGIEFLESNFDNPELSIKQLSDVCNISPEYFRKLYKDKFGISPRKAIVQKRIEKSCSLLQIGYYSVENVATLCGFRDSKYFSTLFHKIMKISPRDYKKKYNQ